MRFPLGKPYKTGVSAQKSNLANALKLLEKRKFSGSLCFEQASVSGLILFRDGELIEAVYEDERDKLRELGEVALAKIAVLSKQAGTRLDVYLLSPEFADKVRSVVGGQPVLLGQHLAVVCFDKVMEKVGEFELTGCVRLYTDEMASLIFCEGGQPVCYHNDGMDNTTYSADIATAMSRSSETRVDVISIDPSVRQGATNLLKVLDVEGLFGAPTAPAPPAAPVEQPSAPQVDLPFLESIFAKAIGPIAQIIFKEKMDEWQAGAEKDDVKALVLLLEGEIEDADRLEAFRTSLPDQLR